VVAIAGRNVVAKRRIDLATDFRTGAVFHAGQELPLAQAQALISSSQARFEVESVLKSHALVHAAEGQLFRHVIATASEACRMPAALVPTKDLVSRAARAMELSAPDLTAPLVAMGKALGKPWAADQKESALAALVALGESR
jgi:hypothetical protein